MKNILLPTDFSENANKAFLYALRIANEYNATLYVLHNYQSPVLSSNHAGQPEMLAELYEEIALSKFDFYKKRVPELREMAEKEGLRYENVIFIFEQGPFVQTIQEVCDRENIEFITMGTLGASGIAQKVIGTNTVSVIRNVRLPVLCIPYDASLGDIRKIGFTTLFREKDRAAMRDIVAFGAAFKADIYCIHVLQEGKSAADILEYSTEWRLTHKDANLDFVFLEKEGTVEETIQKFIAENDIDVLAIVKRNRNFFDRLVSSSLSNKLAFHAQTPILVFHEEK